MLENLGIYVRRTALIILLGLRNGDFMAISCLAAIAGGFAMILLMLLRRHRMKGGRRTDGVIVQLEDIPASEYSHVIPRARFTDEWGGTRLTTHSGDARPDKYRLGQSVTVFYDPDERWGARVDTFSMRYKNYLFISGLFFAVAIYLGVFFVGAMWDRCIGFVDPHACF